MPDFSFLDQVPPTNTTVRIVTRNERPRNSFTTGFGGMFGCLLACLCFFALLIGGCIALAVVGHVGNAVQKAATATSTTERSR